MNYGQTIASNKFKIEIKTVIVLKQILKLLILTNHVNQLGNR